MNFKKNKIKVFILSGKASAGKNTIAEFIKSIVLENNKKIIILAYATPLKTIAKNVLGWDGNEETKPRDFLQQVGVELIKNNINSNMLVNRLLEDIEVYSYFYDVVVITDARFKEEIEEVRKKYDSIVIHVYRNINMLSKEQENHITEIALDDYTKYDYEINNISINETKKQIEKIVKENLYE